jgi:hypothetical protein
VAVVLVVFDLLVLGSQPLTALSYHRRRGILEGLGVEGPGLQLTVAYPASQGQALFAATNPNNGCASPPAGSTAYSFDANGNEPAAARGRTVMTWKAA